MTTSLVGSSAGDFWHRLGEVEGGLLDHLSLLGGTATTNVTSAAQLPTRVAAWAADLTANGTADYDSFATLQAAAEAAQASGLDVVAAINQAAQTILVNAAAAATGNTSIPDVPTALQTLYNAMVAASATINHGTVPSVGAQTAATWVTPVGNPVFGWSAVDAAGRSLQYVYPGEVITATITGDSQDGVTAAGQEPFEMVGQGLNPGGPLAWDWLVSGKYGSGASQQGNLADPTVDGTAGADAGNLLVNGTFTTFTTTNQADNWTYAVGVVATNFANGAGTTYYSGRGSLQIISDGTNKNAVTQAFNTTPTTSVGAGGTPYALIPSAVNNTQYAVFLAVKLSASSPANGTLTVDLITGDGTVAGSTTVQDDAGNNQTFDVDLTAIADTNWHTYTGAFRLPKALSTSTYKLRVSLTGTIYTSGHSIYLGAISAQPMTQLYDGGPYFAGFRGSTNPNASGASPDAWTFTVSYTPGKLQKAVWRYYDPVSVGSQNPGLIIPAVASGSATISDTLVA